jgi:hypothetical protein
MIFQCLQYETLGYLKGVISIMRILAIKCTKEVLSKLFVPSLLKFVVLVNKFIQFAMLRPLPSSVV